MPVAAMAAGLLPDQTGKSIDALFMPVAAMAAGLLADHTGKCRCKNNKNNIASPDFIPEELPPEELPACGEELPACAEELPACGAELPACGATGSFLVWKLPPTLLSGSWKSLRELPVPSSPGSWKSLRELPVPSSPGSWKSLRELPVP